MSKTKGGLGGKLARALLRRSKRSSSIRSKASKTKSGFLVGKKGIIF